MKKLLFPFLLITAISATTAFASDYAEGYETGYEEGYAEAEEKYDGFDLISAIGGAVIGFGLGEYCMEKKCENEYFNKK